MPDKNYFAHESAYVDNGCEIGEGTKIWHFCHIMPNCKIGNDCSLGQNVFIASKVILGNNVKVQNNVSIYEGVFCEDDVFLGPSMVFTNVYNPRSGVIRKDEYRKTIVKKGTSIGANATIVCGHDLGQYCFIAAGATVTKPVAAFALMAGTPARRIGWMSEAGERLGDDLICPADGTHYELENPDVLRKKP